MSENQKGKHEANEQAIDSRLENHSNELLKQAKHEAERARHTHKDKLESIRETLESEAKSKAEHTGTAHVDKEPEHTTYWNSHEYRLLAYKQTLGKVRLRLNKREKLVSSVIHQPTVEKIADVSSRTIARPSGVLGGSICAFAVSLIVYVLAKRNGYEMTYTVFGVALLGGFALGLVGEFIIKMTRGLLSRN